MKYAVVSLCFYGMSTNDSLSGLNMFQSALIKHPRVQEIVNHPEKMHPYKTI